MNETLETRRQDEARWRAWLEKTRLESCECIEERLAGFLGGHPLKDERAWAGVNRGWAQKGE